MIERLLAKEPVERYDSTRDLYRELSQIRERYSEAASAQQIPALDAAPASVPAKKRRVAIGIGLAATGLVAGIAFGSLLTHWQPADFSAYKFTPITREEVTEESPAWSPDGKSIAYMASIHGIMQVFTKAVGSPDAVQLTHASDHCALPFWSSDGATIYYSSRGDLWAVGSSGGTPEVVRKRVGAPAALHPDGKHLIFGGEGKMWIGTLKGDEARVFWQAPHLPVSWRQFSPDGSKVAVMDAQNLWLVPYPSGTPRNLGTLNSGSASWFPDSRRLLIGEGPGSIINALSVLDTANGSRQVIYRGAETIFAPSVAPDGKRIAYTAGPTEWNVVEISLPDGRARTMVSGGGISWWPDWAPSGTHFSFTTDDDRAIEDRSTADGFSRRVAQAEGAEALLGDARWAPDGTRFLFVHGAIGRAELSVANASGGPWISLANLTPISALAAHTWSPDGQWIAFVRRTGVKQQLVKMKPAAGATPVVLANANPAATNNDVIQWSPAGDWILYTTGGGLSMVSPDGDTVRELTSRRLLAYGFSKDGGQIYGIFQNATGAGAEWQLYSIDVRTGAEKMLAPLDLPASVGGVAGFSLHPDGKSFLTAISKWPYDIWMLEGFDQEARKSWLDRLFGR